MKPLLAATIEDVNDLEGRYPLYASPKLDGVRALTYKGQLVSRNLKPIPNLYVQDTLRRLPEGLDGELIVGSPSAKDCFRQTTSGIMSVEGNPQFIFCVFDVVDDIAPYVMRYEKLQEYAKQLGNAYIKLVPHHKVRDSFAITAYEESMLEKGYEGVMLRTAEGKYKFGRSTMKEGYLMKLKRFADSEAEILSVVELMHNHNVKTKNALGHSERSSHKAGKVAGGMMGALNVRDVHTGVEFDIGAGFTEYDRNDYWKRRGKCKGEIVKYKFFPGGSKDKPRFPVWLGTRDERDV